MKPREFSMAVSLTIPPVRQWSQLCVLSLLFGTAVTGLVIADDNGRQAPPVLLPSARPEKRVTLGSREVVLVCPVSSSDSLLLVDWQKGTDTIGPGWMRLKLTPDGTLRIKNVHMDDSGMYTCTAVNGYGSVSFTYHLQVVDKSDALVSGDILDGIRDQAPYWKDPAYMQAAKQSVIRRPIGGSLLLECAAGGYPSPDIVWEKNGRVIMENWQGKWTLEIEDLQEKDSGKYSCRVSNLFGHQNATFMVEVSRFHNADADEPKFEGNLPRNLTIPVGADAHFQCRVRSSLQPRIRWLRWITDRIGSGKEGAHQMVPVNGYNYSVLENYPNLTTRGKGNLWLNEITIPKVTKAHRGWYVCVVTSPTATTNHVIYQFAYLQVEKYFAVHLIFGLCAVALFLLVTMGVGVWLCRRRQTAAAKLLNKSASSHTSSSSKHHQPHKDVERSPAKTYPTVLTYPSPRLYSRDREVREVAFRPSPLGLTDPQSTVPLNPSLASMSDHSGGDNHYEATTPFPSNYDHYEPLCQPQSQPPLTDFGYGPHPHPHPHYSRHQPPSELIYPPLHGKR